MKDYLATLVQAAPTTAHGRNVAREYLQARILGALQRAGWPGVPLTQETWRGAVRERLPTSSWDEAVADVRPFLEPGADAALLTPENLLGLLIGDR